MRRRSPERSTATTFGDTCARIRAEIADILRSHHSVVSAWGFGSFFRGEPHRDIDILVVVAVPQDKLLDTARQLRATMLEVEQKHGSPIDLLILTEAEFESRPLRSMSELVQIPITD